ncbi:MAG TPA: M28 family metallopeptidase [Candidatus Limnocylindria bacterium]|nr:M28 family metallopeptidase [Candidatus Limnocylindria bacterium]
MPDILTDLERLQAIATEHGGTRPAGSAGHDASVEFVADELRQAGYVVELQPVALPAFEQQGPSVLEVVGGGAAFEDIRDFKAMLFSGTGDVTAPLYDLGFDPRFEPDQPRGLGCDPNHWTDVPAGVVVLAQPGPCRRLEVVLAAQEAGAVAIVTAYPGWTRDAVLRPTLVDPTGVRIPVIGATEAMGAALAKAALDGASVHVETDTLVETRTSINVIAETPGGDASNVLMLGGHLDSVVDGPGINDNGTGTMTVLEIAREVAALTAANPAAGPAWKVRVAFWTGEEIGLLGSFAYARGLTPDAIGAIRAYLNFDMLGSSNGIRTVYDGQATSNPAASGVVSDLFIQAIEAQGLGWQPEAVGAVSDQFPLDQLGIAVGGLFSGANEHKSAPQAVLFGGTAGAPNDPCYHLECDTVDNVDAVLLEHMARAAAWVAGALISGEVDLAL